MWVRVSSRWYGFEHVGYKELANVIQPFGKSGVVSMYSHWQTAHARIHDFRIQRWEFPGILENRTLAFSLPKKKALFVDKNNNCDFIC